jgi:Heterokaryon incompatibility protein (HET)
MNLARALMCLRDINSTRYYWIDAICIDQSNVSERNAQIQIMGDIYSGAATMRAHVNDMDEEEFRQLGGLVMQTLHYGTLSYDE